MVEHAAQDSRIDVAHCGVRRDRRFMQHDGRGQRRKSVATRIKKLTAIESHVKGQILVARWSGELQAAGAKYTVTGGHNANPNRVGERHASALRDATLFWFS